MFDQISRERLALIYPELTHRMEQTEQIVESAGFIIRVIQGVRTFPEQTMLWQKGRKLDGSFIDPVHHTDVVTYAKAGESWHNLACALDFCPMENGEPIWDRKHPGYAKTIEVAESFGIISGSRWPEPKTDFPHLQLTGRFPENKPDSYALYLFKEGGVQAVWDEIDKQLGIIRK